jgi:hypothetical protein
LNTILRFFDTSLAMANIRALIVAPDVTADDIEAMGLVTEDEV